MSTYTMRYKAQNEETFAYAKTILNVVAEISDHVEDVRAEPDFEISFTVFGEENAEHMFCIFDECQGIDFWGVKEEGKSDGVVQKA